MGKIDLNLAPGAESPVIAAGSPALHDLVAAIAEGAEARDRGEGSTREVIDLVRRVRLGAFRLPVSEGGGGASLRELFELVIDLGQADSNIPHILRNHFWFVELALTARGNPKYERWLGLVQDGQIFGLGASELDTQNIGAGGVNTLLEPRGDDFVLNGTKYYSTGNFYSDVILVNATTPEGRPVSALIRTRQNGVVVDDDWDGIGQRLTASGTTVLKDVPVGRDDVIYTAEEGTKLPHFATLPQLYLTSIITGILRSVVDDAAALVKRRKRNYYHALEAEPAADPLLQQAIGRLASIAYVAEASVLRAADALDAAFKSAADGKSDEDLFREAALRAAKTKIVIDDLALNAATQLFDVGGASAARQNQRLDRHWRNIRTIASHNPVSYKARAIGNYTVNGAPLPSAAFF